jgi:2,3-bisphosphoglycerate-dependent phosphoglycerate mutase
VHEGRYDSPLTDTGRDQVRRRAAAWAATGATFGAIVCGPLVRASESARIVADALGISVRVDASWAEDDNGLLAGLPFAEADFRFPPPTFRTPYHRMGVNGETDVDVHARSAKAMQAIVAAREESILVVAHGGIINAALRSVLGIPLPVGGSGASFGLGDAGFVRLEYEPARHVWTVLEFDPGEITS